MSDVTRACFGCEAGHPLTPEGTHHEEPSSGPGGVYRSVCRAYVAPRNVTTIRRPTSGLVARAAPPAPEDTQRGLYLVRRTLLHALDIADRASEEYRLTGELHTDAIGEQLDRCAVALAGVRE